MKAITCTQCGATIDDVSERSVIIHCEYCGARLLVDQVASPRPLPVDTPEFSGEQPSAFSTVKVIALAIAAFVAIPVLIGIFALGGPKPLHVSSRTDASRPAASPAAFPTPVSSRVSTEPAKPFPVVNYQPRVSWDGPNDMEHFDEPEVDVSSVANLSSDEVKKTVFKDRNVKLRVVINTDGEIDTVQTVSGHPILVEAATASAKRSIFRSRRNPRRVF